MDNIGKTDIPYISDAIVANIPNSSILIYNNELRFVFAGGEELAKRNYKPAEMLGRTLDEVLAPHMVDELKPHYLRALAGEKFQIKLERQDVVYLVTFSYIDHPNIDSRYGIIVSQNISPLVVTERELADQKELYEQVIQGISAGVWHWPDVNYDQQWWSDRYYELLGYAPGEIPATLQNFDVLIHPADRDAAYSIQRKHLLDESTFYIEYRLKTKDGNYKWFLASGKIAFDKTGQPKSMVGSLIDINDRKVAEDMLINTTLKFRGIFNNATGYMALLTPDGRYIECSPSLLSLRRKNLHEILGSYIWDIGTSDVDRLGGERLRSFIELANKGQQNRETVMFAGDTMGTIYLTISAKPIYDTDRKIAYIIMEAHDVTDITNTKNALAYQKQQLENFAHITSHNLRAPAANIAILIDQLRAAATKEDADDILSNLSKSSVVLIDTINTLADILRIREEVNLPLTAINLHKQFNKTKAELSGIIQAANAQFEIDFDQCPDILYPKAYMDSIFVNMVTNSIKYASPEREPKIIIRSYIDDGRPTLTFSDNGMGIDLNRHGGKIFGLYKVFTRRKDAHGVGLFLVKNQVESQGGSISVDSKLNVGTSFTIQF